MASNGDHAPESLLSNTYRHFFSSGQTLSQLKNAALSDRLFPKGSEVGGGVVAGRSLAWKLFLTKGEPLQANLPPRPATLLEQLKDSRAKYAKLLVERTKAPDDMGEEVAAPQKPTGTMRNLNLNNPLSLHNENPWHEWFAALELKKTISQDVERTFPDIVFFREDTVQDELTNILLIYSLTHPSIGYRQGMHELLAPLYQAVYFDSVAEGSSAEPELQQLCSRKYVGADSWALFDSVMQGVSTWYEWQEPDPRTAAGRRQASLSGHVHLVIPEGQGGIQPYIAPIVKACNKIQNEMLKRCDPALWKSMQNAGIEPQIYGIRWLRMLFTREFPMPDSMKLWDGLFACDPTLDLALWVCVAMLIRVRNQLIPADYNGQLTTLLRYPAPPERRSTATVHHACLLVQQALFLQMAPNPASSATVAMENRTAFNTPMEVPEPAPVPPQRRPSVPRHQSGFLQRGANGEGSSMGHTRQSSSPAIGIPEMLARGLIERGESLGINKTLYSAVAELKRNIPDIAGTLLRTPTSSETSFQLEGEPVQERPPWEARSRLEVEGEVASLKKRDKRLGDALGWIVDALLQDEGSVEDVERLKRKRREAVESLSYIRDVLISDAMQLEDERLIGEEEALKRKSEAKKRAAELQAPAVAPVAAPRPVSTIDSRMRQVTERAFARSPPRATPATSEVKEAAPWNYTRSSFSTPSTVVPLPRKPPPTSAAPPRKMGLQSDPLGAL